MSSLIKSAFVSLSDQKKKIEVILPNSDKIINSPLKDQMQEADRDEDILENVLPDPGWATQQILDRAHAEAEQILQEAEIQAEQMRSRAYEEGFARGLQEGKAKGLQEVSDIKQKLEAEIRFVKEERNALVEEMEPQIAAVIRELVENMVGLCEAEDDTILFLIRKGLEELELRGDVIIHVSDLDFEFAMENRAKLAINMNERLNVEIAKDSRLNKNQCIIETELGSINCSLDERLNGLRNQLKLIEKSFTKHQ